MILLTVRDLIRRFDAEPVLNNVAFDVRTGDRIGLVGPNGAGKTTLMNILIGKDHQDTGEIETPQSVELALLEQEADYAPNQTLIAEARKGLAHLYELQEQAHDLSEKMAGEANADALAKLQKQYDTVQHELERLDAYHIDHRVDEVLHGLGFTDDEYDRPLSTFSGGQQNRVSLARLLLRSPGVMLLDEPTNHLDIAATEWLEGYLAGCSSAVILVSHDRYFLDRVTNRTFELMGGRLTDYPGNFTAYRRQRDERNKVLGRTFEKQQEFIAKTEDFIRRNKYGQKHAQAADREKKLARVDAVDKPPEEPTLHMSFGDPSRTGDWVIDAVDVAKGYGEPLFENFTLRIDRGDRLGILGPNGSGKTTLLRTLIGDLKADAGKIRHGTGVEIGYFDQQLALVDPASDCIDAVRPPGDPAFTPGMARALLARFGLSGDIVFQKVGSLSGGEKSRVALAKISASNVNVLVLDEPTNHLDLWACDALERVLKDFQGTLLFVSHDRYFLDQIATSIVVIDNGAWKTYGGNYSDFLRFQENIAQETGTNAEDNGRPRKEEPAKTQAAEEGETTEKRRRKFPYRKVSEIEADIAEQEELLESLQDSLADPAILRDGDRTRETKEAFEETQEALAVLYEHWEEAMELN